MLAGDMLRRSAERFPSKTAVIWEDQTISYKALNQTANKLANALISAGVKKGEKVAMLCRNRLEYAIVFFGVARSGAVLVNVSTLYSPDELAFVLEKADVTTLFYESIFKDKADGIKGQPALLSRYISIGAETDDTDFEDFYAQGEAHYPSVELKPDDPFCMTYTGGTTGRPKGVLCSHLNRYITAHTVAMEEALDERDVIGMVTPLFHVAALNIMFQPAVLVGATSVFLTKWSPDAFAQMVRQNRMTAAFMVPTQIAMVVSDPGFDAQAYESWRKVSFAGAPMPDWVQKEMMRLLPNVAMTQIYGQSEMGVLTSLRAWYLQDKLGSIGRQAYNVDIALIDQQGHPVPPGKIGEVASRGNNVMLEYYNEPEQTAAFWRNGWAITGDLAVMDEEGFITLVDRAKDMIISGGENVYPKEIENAIYELDAVAECAVFGIPDDKWGEIPIAYVLLKSGATLSEAQIVDHCAQRLARFKRPRQVKFVDSFPKTPIGKIQKNLLRDKYWQGKEKKI
ncbi:MAG: long-chain fatty acid--CoA ligase [Pusillimonas sp.]|mgnify:FL=1|nr:long-chain fatty acid--CoA ligase [Pusillimonas sp.]MBC43670.1 long-chain fatty acid--CoA ligase [Pusillimonas sp.]HCN71820.1 long-chain fatty acid--CoA ligase [Pusillimonas sp.]|tara:strand:+ start:51612 stop:53141 length:1530 start_codon:yes stop_codon:yes gene_type:complete